MPYTQAIFGIDLGKIKYTEFLKCVASRITVISPDRPQGLELEFDGNVENYPELSKYKLVLYPDIQAKWHTHDWQKGTIIIDEEYIIEEDITFTLIEDPKVKFGRGTCCSYMIYIEGVSNNKWYHDETLNENTVQTVLNWRKKGLEHKRITSENTIKLLGWCCS